MYYAVAKNGNRLTLEMLCDMIVDETSLSRGDVMNALITLARIVCRGVKMGFSIDMGDLGSLRVYFPSKMMDKEEDVTAETLKTPKIIYTPKAKMRQAARAAEVSVINKARQKKAKTPKP